MRKGVHIKVVILRWLPCWSKEARFKLLYNTTLVLMRTPKAVHSVLDHILLKRYKKRVKSWGENAGGWVLMIIPSGNGCGSTVAIMQKVSPKKGCGHGTRVLRHQGASTPKCYGIKVLRHQSATTPRCFGTRVLRHQSGTQAKWCHQHDAL